MESYIPPRYGRHAAPTPKDQTNPPPPIESNDIVLPAKKYPPGFAFAKPTGFNPLPIVILILLTSPYIKAKDERILSFDSQIGDSLGHRQDGPYSGIYYDDNSSVEDDGILDILSAIYPYMDRGTGEIIHSIFGLAEAHSILKRLANKDYRTSRLYVYEEEAITDRERLVGIIRAMQPFISLEYQTLVNKILEIDDTLEKLSSRIMSYRAQNIDILDAKGQNFDRLKEAMDIVKIVIAPEQRGQIDGIINIIRMMETIELAQIFGSSPKNARHNTVPRPVDGDNNANTSGTESSTRTLSEDGSDMSGALKSLLSPEQSKSLDLIIKMARLMSQAKEDSQSAD